MRDHLLVLTRYSRLGASSRLRTLQYHNWFQDAGFEVEYESLFDDAYLHKLYSGKKSGADVLRHYRNRVSRLRRPPLPKLIWIEYEVLPWLPWMFEHALLPANVPIVSDYDDAVFHRYDLHRFVPVRWLLGEKIDRVMQRSRLVIAGNNYLADRARHAGAAHIQIVPTVVDQSHYTVRSESPANISAQVGWIGTPETWDAFGQPLYLQLDDALVANGARFRALGARLEAESVGSLDIVPWSEDTEVSAIHTMDVGVMPLPDTPWARGKCGYKLIQYMACGLPVVASPVGVNRDIVEHGVNGFLAETSEEWCTAIETLLSNAELRCRMGDAGRRKVEMQYSLQVWGPRVARMLRNVVEEGQST